MDGTPFILYFAVAVAVMVALGCAARLCGCGGSSGSDVPPQFQDGWAGSNVDFAISVESGHLNYGKNQKFPVFPILKFSNFP